MISANARFYGRIEASRHDINSKELDKAIKNAIYLRYINPRLIKYCENCGEEMTEAATWINHKKHKSYACFECGRVEINGVIVREGKHEQ